MEHIKWYSSVDQVKSADQIKLDDQVKLANHVNWNDQLDSTSSALAADSLPETPIPSWVGQYTPG